MFCVSTHKYSNKQISVFMPIFGHAAIAAPNCFFLALKTTLILLSEPTEC